MLDINTGLALGVAVLSLLWWLSVRRPAGAPPGPWLAVPLLGHLLLMMKKDPRQQFAVWRRQYGDVFSLYLGSQLVVVLNGYKVIKEALVKNPDAFSGRPHSLLLDIITDSKGKLKSSVVDTSGPVWKAQRKVSTQILRELGMGKNVLAAKIEEEVKEYIRVISESQGQPLDLKHLTQASVSNNMCSIVFGKRFEWSDKMRLLRDHVTRGAMHKDGFRLAVDLTRQQRLQLRHLKQEGNRGGATLETIRA
ncbi:hypothetical protein C0Q70_11701 [Pomacea canaliculata]|uniref:Uncharacterized protein n=1 Tax=Pomacea canaliculata TaxID=400727 RepID=A0A2T7P6Q2_POMCA|nr:hypothetical protein C0Q70_11701 [Pomacea canaliculata]